MLNRFDQIERAVIALINCGASEALDSIGRQLRTTKSKVFRALRKADRLSVLGITQPFIDYTLLGLTSYWVPIGFGCRNDTAFRVLLNRIRASSSVTSAFSMGGKYQLLLILTLPSPAMVGPELDRLLDLRELSNADFSVLTQISSTFFGRRYLSPQLTLGSPCETSLPGKIHSLTATEERLLSAMLQKESVNASELGRTLGVNVSTSTRCLRSLEERGIIRGYVRDLNTAALGLQRYSLLVSAAGSSSALISSLKKFLEVERSVVSMTEFIGAWHIELHCEVSRPEEIAGLTQRLYHAAGNLVRAVEVVPVLSTLKFRTFPGFAESSVAGMKNGRRSR